MPADFPTRAAPVPRRELRWTDAASRVALRALA